MEPPAELSRSRLRTIVILLMGDLFLLESGLFRGVKMLAELTGLDQGESNPGNPFRPRKLLFFRYG